MQWNYNALANPNVIIGFSSGNGLYVNSHLHSPFASVADKFRPDKMAGNTGLKGRWVYRLDSNSNRVTNPKRFCKWWYNRQPDPRTWNRFLGTCPCSFNQGGRDTSFRRRRNSVGSRSSSMLISDDLQQAISREGRFVCFLPGPL